MDWNALNGTAKGFYQRAASQQVAFVTGRAPPCVSNEFTIPPVQVEAPVAPAPAPASFSAPAALGLQVTLSDHVIPADWTVARGAGPVPVPAPIPAPVPVQAPVQVPAPQHSIIRRFGAFTLAPLVQRHSWNWDDPGDFSAQNPEGFTNNALPYNPYDAESDIMHHNNDGSIWEMAKTLGSGLWCRCFVYQIRSHHKECARSHGHQERLVHSVSEHVETFCFVVRLAYMSRS